jgi:hypothetical protein
VSSASAARLLAHLVLVPRKPVQALPQWRVKCCPMSPAHDNTALCWPQAGLVLSVLVLHEPMQALP